MSPLPPPTRPWVHRRSWGLAGLGTAGLLLLLWACGSTGRSTEPAGGDRPPQGPPGGPAHGRPSPRRAAADPCAAALARGEATRTDAAGRPLAPLSPAPASTHHPSGSASTQRPFYWFATANHGTTGRAVDEVELWYLAHPKGSCMEVFIDGKLLGRISTRTRPRLRSPSRPVSRSRKRTTSGLRLVTRLDLEATDRGRHRLAHTAAGHYFEARRIRLRRGPHRVELRPVGRGTLRLFGVVMRRRAPGVMVHTLGVPGAQVSNVAPGHRALFGAQLHRLHPDLLLVMLGTNDAFEKKLTARRFERRLTRLLRRLRGARARPDCLILGAPDFGSSSWRRARRLRRKADMIRRVQRAVAAREGCAYWDVLSAMGGRGAIRRLMRSHPRLAYRDRIHLTRRGYSALGSLLHQELMRRYAAYLGARRGRHRLRLRAPTARERRAEARRRRRWPAGMGPTPMVSPQGKALARFFRRLELVHRGVRGARARVVVLGDSHTAGDSLAGELRYRLQRTFGDAGHGYLHVGKPWTGYGHQHVRFGILGPWRYYYILTWNRPGQPRDRLYGAGGVSTWIETPVPSP